MTHILVGLAILMLLSFSGSAWAEHNYFSDKFITVRAYGETPSYQLALKSRTDNSKIITWKPNIRAITGFDFAIHGLIGAGIGFVGLETAKDRDTKGQTDYMDYRFALSFKRFYLGLNYQRYEGFYADGTQGFNPAQPEYYLQQRHMVAGNASANFTWIVEPNKFSYMAALDQTARQETSGGSMLWGLAVSHTYFSAQDYMLPAAIRSQFGEDQTLKSGRFTAITGKVGYGHTFAWTQKFFTSLALNLGLGNSYANYVLDLEERKESNVASKADALVSIGYNGDAYLIALIITGDYYTYLTRSIELPTALASGRLAIGAHF